MINDLKHALRMLLKAPGFTIIAVLTLALGIGANSAIFSVVDTVLLRPLSFPNPEQLVMLWGTATDAPTDRGPTSLPDFVDFRDQSQSFSAMAAYTRARRVLAGVGDPQEIEGVATTSDFFRVLGVSPLLGRTFTAEETRAGAPDVVVISHGLWRRAFASDPQVIGREVVLALRPCTVIGVMPPGWKFPVEAERSDFIVPVDLAGPKVSERGWHFLRMIGRLKPGVTAARAEAELKPIAKRQREQYPHTNADRDVGVFPLRNELVGDVRPALLILLGAVALVLLIACANVANLLLARGAARAREIGIRTALGASRGRIVRQLLAESFLLALLGGAAGLLLAWWGVDALRAFGPRNVPRLGEVEINASVCAFTFGLSILSTLVFGLVPALQVSRPNLNQALQEGSKGSTGGWNGTRSRSLLVVAQVSLSLVLLSGAGLLIQSFFNLRATDPGFDPARLLVVDQVLPRAAYSEPEAQRRFFERLLPKLAALPGVESVAGAYPLPFSGGNRYSSFQMASEPDRGAAGHPSASHLVVIPGYFRTMKIPLRGGRDFDGRDNESATDVALVNETFVRRFLPGKNPIGERILFDEEEGAKPLEIIGVVGDAKRSDLGAETEPEFYQPFAQAPGSSVWLTLRTATENLSGLEAAIRRSVLEQDPDLFVKSVQPMESLLGKNLARPKFNMLLLGIFAFVALALAAIGIYGVIAFSVAQRTREIGIRMALGAQRGNMLAMMLRQSLTVVGIGLGIGLLASLAGTRLLKSLLHGVAATDPLTYALVVLLLGGAAFFASYIPARRAMRVDPMVALRHE